MCVFGQRVSISYTFLSVLALVSIEFGRPDACSIDSMSHLGSDFRLAARALRKNSLLTIVGMGSLAIGIGANTTIFTLTDRILLRSLPVRNPEELVLFTRDPRLPGFIETNYGNEVSFSWPSYEMFRDKADVFSGVIARFPFAVAIAGGGQAEPGRGELVSGNYFDVLGVRPLLGRTLSADDDRTPGGHPVAVLSYRGWISHFGGRSTALNQSILVNGHPFTVVGILPRGFQSAGAGEAPDIFVPMMMKAQMTPGWDGLKDSRAYWLNILGRVKPGVSIERAQAAADVVWRRYMDDELKKAPAGWSAKARGSYVTQKLTLQRGAAGISSIRDDASQPLYILSAVVGLVLLIACANVANLLLARAAAREKEIAIRVSLGATRMHLIRQLLAESAILSLGGGLLGLLVSSWAGSVLLAMLPKDLPIQGINADPDGRVLAFAFCVSVITGLLFGSVPAFRGTRPDVAPVLKEQSASLGSQAHARFRRALVAGQIALSVLLLAVAGVFVHSLFNLAELDPGFRSERLLTFGMNPSLSGYAPARSLALYADIQRELATLPGVVGVSIAQQAVLAGSMDMSAFNIEGYQPSEGDKHAALNDNEVGRGFFSVLGIPLVAGREFTGRDLLGAPRVAIVNETFVKQYSSGRNPIGLHLTQGRRSEMPIEIVGVVKDAKYDFLREKPKAFLYLAAAQDEGAGGMNFYIRTTLPAASLATSVRGLMARRDSNLPAVTVRPVREQILDGIFLDRLVAVLASAFALIATLLAAVGLYGVISWSVTRRRREMGIRVALGAHTGDVLRLILSEVLSLGVVGIAIAVPVWFAAAKVLQSQLFGVTIRDPLTLTSSVAILSLVAAAAGFIPALRAARVDPISAIRYE